MYYSGRPATATCTAGPVWLASFIRQPSANADSLRQPATGVMPCSVTLKKCRLDLASGKQRLCRHLVPPDHRSEGLARTLLFKEIRTPPASPSWPAIMAMTCSDRSEHLANISDITSRSVNRSSHQHVEIWGRQFYLGVQIGPKASMLSIGPRPGPVHQDLNVQGNAKPLYASSLA